MMGFATPRPPPTDLWLSHDGRPWQRTGERIPWTVTGLCRPLKSEFTEPLRPSWARPVSSVRVMRCPILTWSSTGPPASDSSKLVRVNLVSSTSTTSLPSAKPGYRWSGNTDVAHAPVYDCIPICSQLDTRERLITPPSPEVDSQHNEPRARTKLVPPIQAPCPTTTFDVRFVRYTPNPQPPVVFQLPHVRAPTKSATQCSTATTATPAPIRLPFGLPPAHAACSSSKALCRGLGCRRRSRKSPKGPYSERCARTSAM